MKNKLEQFRTRWYRWLGQKTRWDKDSWVSLLDCNWSGWANKIVRRIGGYPTISPTSNRIDVYFIFRDAIADATMEELRELDRIFCTDLIEKRGLQYGS